MTAQRSMGFTTIVLAGDRTASHPVFGRNKSLLPLRGRPLVAHVVRTLMDVPAVDAVWVVGPEAKLRAALADLPPRAGQQRHIMPQGRTLYDNVWSTFLRILTDTPTPDEAALEAEFGDTTIAIIPGDIPLATAAEIEDFLDRADLTQHDYVLGLTPIEALQPFAPNRAHMGVRMAALNVAEGGFRQNNLHILRPFRVGNKHYVEEFYEHRYQKEWWNMFRIVATIATRHEGTLRAVMYVLRMQIAMRAQALRWPRIAAWARRGVHMDDVSAALSRLLRTRFTTLICPAAGAALDIDNEHDLAAMTENYTTWRQRLLRETYAA